MQASTNEAFYAQILQVAEFGPEKHQRCLEMLSTARRRWAWEWAQVEEVGPPPEEAGPPPLPYTKAWCEWQEKDYCRREWGSAQGGASKEGDESLRSAWFASLGDLQRRRVGEFSADDPKWAELMELHARQDLDTINNLGLLHLDSLEGDLWESAIPSELMKALPGQKSILSLCESINAS